jgi:xanthosine utilization system XapX-like protein
VPSEKEQLRVTNESLLIGAAAFMFAFGVFLTVLERNRHPPATPVITFTGIVGVYLGLCATVEHIRWLYLPCLVLLLSVAAIQLRAFRRSGRDDDNRRTGGTA